ncbi:hypothetical protein [Auraticoccus monumenti]|uniref:Uncharacterized protein n=1 Tax=Auraticoccus monumenti TaxID=675864 RepID=A0A1G6RUY9_9ACTN|nr:hypothetical protein [Auraticoccus monumenti]SDD08500.1 hypothetical protein SAMN04489747_0128 [Auraticoccus monumenti]
MNSSPSAVAPRSLVGPTRDLDDDVSALLWEPFADWEYRPDPVGYQEDDDAVDHWVYEVLPAPHE